MKKISIILTNNGYRVIINDGEYVFKSTEELVMLEWVGKYMLGTKVSVTYK